ncbi:D-amino-acid:oxygen oxidoreductase (deaminating) [Nocardia pseudobrasiliensis]|uniref:D-amino-acid oxidase n=2 Tax=Nocardia pseudobrasiliensis TaxID=45979 RepID=A0A370HWH2_9NOCA|nr:D-amino-acid:oxygen oxidoreductase (deaminating) [Nocardia pseudobrasiliensis]
MLTVMQAVDVVVVGAGVSGLTTAVILLERGKRVLIRSATEPTATTSMVAGAMAGGPVMTEPLRDALRWNEIGLRVFGELAGRSESGVRMAQGRLVSRLATEEPSWAASLPGYRPCTEQEFAGYPTAFWISTPLIDMPVYLRYLWNRFEAAGGKLEVAPVSDLAELDAAVVVNCAGVGAGELAGDPQVHPVRGQHVMVENPGLTEFFAEGGASTEWTSYFPHAERVVLGGVADIGDANLEPDPTQTEQILERCIAVEPRLAGARVLGVEVGLRPGRSSIRVDSERRGNKLVVHNYGHGSVGIAMSWGCATDAADLCDGGRIGGGGLG